MAWFRQLRPDSEAKRTLDALTAGTLAASEDALQAASDLQRSARRDRIKTRWVARKAERRAKATATRRKHRHPVVIDGGVDAIVSGMLGEVDRGRATDGRH